MSKRFSLMVFDMDGTLLDTLGDLAFACNQGLCDMGLSGHEAGAYKLFVGNGANELCRRALPEGMRTDSAIKQLRGRFDLHYKRCCFDSTRAYGGIVEALSAASAEGIKLAVLSNKPHEFTGQVADRLLPPFFFRVLGSREGVPQKPCPAALLELMEAAGASREETAYFGDSGVDMQTGKSAGVFTVGCLWGFRSREELLSAGADILLENPDEIISLVKIVPAADKCW